MPTQTENHRYHLLDFLRGILILAVVLYHANYIALNSYSISWFNTPFWESIQPIGVVFFFVLSGISFALFASRNPKKYGKSYRKKAILLATIALGITLVSHTFEANNPVLFGIIHFFALSFLVLPFFYPLGYANILLGIFCIALGMYFNSFTIENPYWFWVGLRTNSFWSSDYFPFFPNFGYVLLGLCFGKYAITSNMIRYFKADALATNPLTWVGRFSLWVYVIHVPILVALFEIVSSL